MEQMHTVQHFRDELFLSNLIEHEVRDAWESKGSKTILDRCAEKVEELVANHKPNKVSRKLEGDMQRYIDEVAARSIEEFYKYEGMSAETPDYIPGN
jgi:trimethylamine:corrinoid methyltransferase-like protein